MERYIFLDIDGVLNTETNNPKEKSPTGFAGIYTSKLKLLKQIIEKTNAQIILSSTWRDEWDLDYNHCSTDGKYLTDRFNQFKISINTKLPGLSSMHRGKEIKDYVKQNNIQSWIVIDDYTFPDFKENNIYEVGKIPRWIRPGYSNGGGLQLKHVKRAEWMFNNQERIINND